METKKSKYDTNPLDPDFVKHAEEAWGEDGSAPETQEVKRTTREVGSDDNARSNIYSEAPTRRYDNPPLDSPYPSVFVPPTYSPPTPYRPSPAPYRPPDQNSRSRSVAGIGLPEKWALMLPYVPSYIGVVPALLSIVVIQMLFGAVGAITGSSIGGSLFKLASIVFLIISMVRVWKGEPHQIAPIAEPAQWFNQHIEPRNKS